MGPVTQTATGPKTQAVTEERTRYRKDGSEGVIRCLSWNIKGLSQDKQNDKDFVDYINEYDIVCFCEMWTGKNSLLNLNGYKLFHSYRRFQNRCAKRKSGGLVIYVKNSTKNGIKLIKYDLVKT